MTERQYLPTLADLIDRLSIVLMKQIFLDPGRYTPEALYIMHDIDMLLESRGVFDAKDIRATLILMLTNRFIWENEAEIRSGGASSHDKLRASHSVNGIRNRAKNVIADKFDERSELKIDCLAADLPPEFGNWNVL